MTTLLLLIHLLASPIEAISPSDAELCLSKAELQLYQNLMAYRKSKKLPKVPISKSLTIVAQTHARDLMAEKPVSKRCNLHSWSGTGDWSKCCYTSDHKRAKCMWDKPRELTNYKGDGYEIAHWHSGGATPFSALEGWKKSRGHNMVMINRGIWKDVDWKAVGVGIDGQYAVVWFGSESDQEKVYLKKCE